MMNIKQIKSVLIKIGIIVFLILFSIRVITPASRATEPNEFAKLNEFTPFALKL